MFPSLSSLPYAIKLISKISSNSEESVVKDFLMAAAPWLDLAKQPFIEKMIKNLPPELYSYLRNLIEECSSCSLGLSIIYKNFPIFSSNNN